MLYRRAFARFQGRPSRFARLSVTLLLLTCCLILTAGLALADNGSGGSGGSGDGSGGDSGSPTLTLRPASGSVTTEIKARWNHMAKGATVTIIDKTIDVGVLCSDDSNDSGNGSCSWTITSTEGPSAGQHVIQASDGSHTVTATLTIVSSVAALDPAELYLLVIALAGVGVFHLRRQL